MRLKTIFRISITVYFLPPPIPQRIINSLTSHSQATHQVPSKMEEYALPVILPPVPSAGFLSPADLLRFLLDSNMFTETSGNKVIQEIVTLYPHLKAGFCTQLNNQKTDSSWLAFRGICVSNVLSYPFRTECQAYCVTLFIPLTNTTHNNSLQIWKQLRKQGHTRLDGTATSLSISMKY